MHKSILRRCLISRTAKVAGLLIVFISVWSLLSSPPVAATGSTTLVAWGAGTTNTGSNFEFGQSIIPAALSGVTAIAAGDYHSLAVKSDGTVVAWGAGTTDTLSDPEPTDPEFGQSIVPAGLTGVTAVAAGKWHSVALKSDGTVVAWGAGATGTHCFPDCGQTMVPAGLTGVTAISAGQIHTMALKSDGTVVTWGAIGDDLGQNNIPAGLSGVKAISAGWYHNLALKTDGTVVAWGWNDFGQTDVPAGLSDVKAVAAGFRFSAALKNDGTVVVWGGEGGAQNPPAGLTNVTAIAANAYDIQALKSDGTVVAWGANFNHAAEVPAGLTGVMVIAGGAAHTIALVGPPTPVYNFAGFFKPVDNLPNLNVATAGSAIPVKFGLDGDQGLNIFAAGYPVSGQIACDENEPGTEIEETVIAGGSSLSYDASSGQYNYVWKTNKAWTGTCRMLDVRFLDGSDHLAKFRFK